MANSLHERLRILRQCNQCWPVRVLRLAHVNACLSIEPVNAAQVPTMVISEYHSHVIWQSRAWPLPLESSYGATRYQYRAIANQYEIVICCSHVLSLPIGLFSVRSTDRHAGDACFGLRGDSELIHDHACTSGHVIDRLLCLASRADKQAGIVTQSQ